MGRRGVKVIADTNKHTAGSGTHTDIEAFGLGVVITDTVFNAATTVIKGDAPSTSVTYPANFSLRMMFGDVKLDSGAVQFDRVEKINEYTE